MAAKPHSGLSRRERQIMDILYQRGKATAAQVQEALEAGPGYSAVRAMLRILEEKGHARHQQDGPRYVYLPKVPRERLKKPVLAHLVETYFEGSVEQAVTALLDGSARRMSPEELDRLAVLIDRAKRGER
ncbi:MAG: BlaI/MecI/CopY family transcriptional regulator [Acidobacteria bacterium]|nr:BlaI/MecI/CopY family transcriptional regulator [Acidobacteriota bacterium]